MGIGHCQRCQKRLSWPGNWNVNRVRFCKECRPAAKRQRERERRASRHRRATTIVKARTESASVSPGPGGTSE